MVSAVNKMFSFMLGSQYDIESTVFMDPVGCSTTHVYMCKLSSDHRYSTNTCSILIFFPSEKPLNLIFN